MKRQFKLVIEVDKPNCEDIVGYFYGPKSKLFQLFQDALDGTIAKFFYSWLLLMHLLTGSVHQRSYMMMSILKISLEQDEYYSC